MPFRVLMVCTGNTCRSPLAEGILRALVPTDAPSITVASAGTAGFDGAPATRLARDVARSHGVDISAHRSAALTRRVLEGADLVLAMTGEHEDDVVSLAPEARGRAFLLSEFAEGTRRDVPDPVGGTLENYEGIYAMLEGYLRRALPKIVAMAEGKA
jgi:protein-tyrosine phosphatase